MTDDDSKFPSELADRFQVRMPAGMRDRIKAAAEANNRSMNAEIVATLEEKYPAPVQSRIDRLLALAQQLENLAKRREAATSEEEKSNILDEFIELSAKLSDPREIPN
ncbi:MAG: Arc family DNA-binding protein [Paracoccus sp. (in: a-proteobacteria)]|nr:Arc family DNA-binding protein [Paracoccus sp. (in: a-proteobacteria)]